jgi:hypothetical protein
VTAVLDTAHPLAANGNNASISVTVPAAATAGQYGILAVAENASDVITGLPTGLTQLDATSYSTGTLPARLYGFWVGTSGFAPGAAIAIPLSLTRAWAAAGVLVSGVDPTTPAPLVIAATSAATTVAMPATSSPTTEPLLLLEAAVAKANAAQITSWTAPTGWTVAASVGTNTATTFAPSSVIGSRNAGLAAPGSYGGETYTPNGAVNVSTRWLIGLRSAAAGAGTRYTVPAGWSEVRRFRRTDSSGQPVPTGGGFVAPYPTGF